MDAAQRLIARIRAALPNDAAGVDECMRSHHSSFDDWDPVVEMPNIWVEAFSQCTTDAIKNGEMARAESHLKLISRLLHEAEDEDTVRCIDVSYVESLMWD